jgi:3-deoxy-D-manno-octulosonic-acid transferase
MRKSLHKFSHIFVQDSSSLALVKDSGYAQVSVAGDTRFDRVSRLSKHTEALPKEIQGILTAFSAEKPLFVGGSVWPEDMSILGMAFEKTTHNIKFVLAPHKVDKASLETLLQALPIQLQKQSVWLSKTNPQEASKASVLIVDRIGILNQVYPLAQMAYVGGGFKTGLHNTLEAAVYGIPLAIGPNFNKFKEAKDLVAHGGIQVINTTENATQFLELAVEKPYIEQIKGIQTSYISAQLGATSKIMSQIAKYF